MSSDTASPSRIPELTVVMPCLNEADTLGVCLDKAFQAMVQAGIDGEVVVADNGSTDGSLDIAAARGARVEHVAQRGYGSALMGGINAARGRFVLMGDADDSYDFLELSKFVEKLRTGLDLVQGCRLPAGGGTVLPGAMPWSHRWIGNPILTRLVRLWFGAPIHDVYCGMRGFTKSYYDTLGMRCTGMEFATEMIIKASLRKADIAEVPITLHPDGRVSHAPHLRTFRDGWRTLRFFLMCTPRWLYIGPGVLLMAVGVLGYALALPAVTIAGATFDAHTLVFASLALICGYQALVFGVLTKAFSKSVDLVPMRRGENRLARVLADSRVALVGVGAGLLGAGLLGVAVLDWWRVGFGPLDYAHTMRWVVPGSTLVTLGFLTVLASFFAGVLGLRRR